jgi:hypothetical protein
MDLGLDGDREVLQDLLDMVIRLDRRRSFLTPEQVSMLNCQLPQGQQVGAANHPQEELGVCDTELPDVLQQRRIELWQFFFFSEICLFYFSENNSRSLQAGQGDTFLKRQCPSTQK